MNIPRYLWNENVKYDLLQFLKEANEAKSDIYCNFEQYKQIKHMFPLNDGIKQDFKTYIEKSNICIDITQSDDETEQNEGNILKERKSQNLDEINDFLSNSIQNLDQTNINDIIDSIRDSLCIQNEVSNLIIKDLSCLSSDNLDKVFLSLSHHLSLADLENFWNSLIKSNNSEHIILYYVRFLLLPKARQEFTYELQTIFISLSQKYSAVLKNELVIKLLEIDLIENETNRVLQQYISTLDNEFKTDLLRNFVSTCEKLHPNYILIIEVLLNPQTDIDILGKLIEAMSNAATEFINDNKYGKLLFNIVNQLERNVSPLEQPLKHILGIHRSIWKIKVQKVVVTWFDESLTQSFV